MALVKHILPETIYCLLAGGLPVKLVFYVGKLSNILFCDIYLINLFYWPFKVIMGSENMGFIRNSIILLD